jgi:hypothetical protein
MSRPKGFKHTEETKQKIREKAEERWSNPLFKMEQCKLRVEYCRTHPEFVHNNAAQLKIVNQEYWSNPENRTKRSVVMKEHWKENPNQINHSELMKEVYKDPKLREKKRERALEQWSDPEKRKKKSEDMIQYYIFHDQYERSPDTLKKLSDSLKEWHSTHDQPIGSGAGKGRHVLHDGKRIWLRSTYETRYAGVLDVLGIDWKYEYKSFYISLLDSSYRPDFYLPDYDLWVEVKGWMSDDNRIKLSEFHEQYPNEKLIIVYLSSIEDLEHEIGCYVPIDINKFGVDIVTDQVGEML